MGQEGNTFRHNSFFIRIMAWLCTCGNRSLSNGKMCIVTGPNIDAAIKLIKGMKAIFERNLGLIFTNKETVLEFFLILWRGYAEAAAYFIDLFLVAVNRLLSTHHIYL